MDYTAAVFPVSKVDQALDVKKPRENFFSKADEYFYNLCRHIRCLLLIQVSLALTDDPAVWQNAPTCLQLVGQTLEEEAVIAMTEIADAAIKAYKPNQSKI